MHAARLVVARCRNIIGSQRLPKLDATTFILEMKNSSVRNSNGMKAENNSVENLKNLAFTTPRNGSSLEEEKICDVGKPKRHSGKTSSISRDAGDKKQTGNESSKLTYTSEDGIHYEPGGMPSILRFFMHECLFN